MQYYSQQSCDNIMDDKIALYRKMLFSDLCKIMVNNVIFVGFRGGDLPPGSAPDLTEHRNDIFK